MGNLRRYQCYHQMAQEISEFKRIYGETPIKMERRKLSRREEALQMRNARSRSAPARRVRPCSSLRDPLGAGRANYQLCFVACRMHHTPQRSAEARRKYWL